MREVPDKRLSKARVRKGRFKSDDRLGNMGVFLLIGPRCRLRVIVDDGRESGWEHVSVSPKVKHRCPTWEEMCWVKDIFWDEEEVVFQIHPARSEYVNAHPYVLHMWRPAGQEIPLPPSILVGPI
jgi:hypothetical protein